MKITVLDTTLRDGAQGYGISFSVQDKRQIIAELDALGIDIIEAGNPAACPKDAELLAEPFALSHARMAAFGSTRHKDNTPEIDPSLAALVACACPIAVIFGKSSKTDSIEIIRTTPEENLRMIADSVAYLTQKGKEVIYDAEHFFDGYIEDPEYALSTLLAAQQAGAASVCLCDTCGGTLPGDAARIVECVTKALCIPVSIHAHNDSGLAAALSLAAVQAGATGVQGTLIGTGERCGNACLSTIIPNLVLKMGCECIAADRLQNLTGACRTVAEISNILLQSDLPYVGKNAFSHKAGMHVNAILKQKGAYEHIAPESVGNKRRVLLSEYSGKGTLLKKLENVDATLAHDQAFVEELLRTVKQMEHAGYLFEGADATFELLALRTKGTLKRYFNLDSFKVMEEQSFLGAPTNASAMVKITVGQRSELSAAEGKGPVDAMDQAMRRALLVFYPAIKQMRLTDFKVRVLDSSAATSARVRVMIESSDGVHYWTTLGVSTDIIEASALALTDSMLYKLYQDEKNSRAL